MTFEQERGVELLTTRTAFEGEVVASALRERGIRAQVLADPQLHAWTMHGARVMVLEGQLEEARRALGEIRAAAQADQQAELDEPQEPRAQHHAQGGRRMDRGDELSYHELEERRRAAQLKAALTLGVGLVPFGLALLAYSTVRPNELVRGIGGIVLLTSAVLIVYVLVKGGRSS